MHEPHDRSDIRYKFADFDTWQFPVREVARAAVLLRAQAESILESACGRTWMRCPAVGRGEESDAAFASYRGMGCDPKL